MASVSHESSMIKCAARSRTPGKPARRDRPGSHDMATYRQVVQHLRALAHQTGPLRCAERRDVGDGEMTRASITYEQQRLVDAKSDYQRRTRRSQNMHRGQPHPAAARSEVLPRAALRVRACGLLRWHSAATTGSTTWGWGFGVVFRRRLKRATSTNPAAVASSLASQPPRVILRQARVAPPIERRTDAHDLDRPADDHCAAGRIGNTEMRFRIRRRVTTMAP